MDPTHSRLPQPFIRGLEADLRSLSFDARRRNPSVKEAAERVILLLKEADSSSAETTATDEAASAFCAACEPLDTSQSSTALSLQIKVALRAVSCLHKLLTHRALTINKLGQVLDALQRLARPPVDDNLTVKVLQGLLSLLTVRAYAQALAEEDLARAFSLLFVLRSKGGNAGGGGVGALSAISQIGGGGDDGVIEQTSKAAFRQVSSDLFAAASDAAVRTAVEKKVPSGERIDLDQFPSETRAAFSLFLDLCNAANGEALTWVASDEEEVKGLGVGLALEVIDDALARNIALFGGQQVFVEKMSGKLCPVLHRLLRTATDKGGLKSLLGLVVTVVKGYWRILQPDSEALLYALAKMAVGDGDSWRTVYSMEALRCIFKAGTGEGNPLIEFVQAFDASESSSKLIAGVVSTACDSMSLVGKVEIEKIPSAPVSGNMKPFANTIVNTAEFLVAIATGLYIEVIRAASEAACNGLKSVAVALLSTDTTERAVALLGKMFDLSLSSDSSALSRTEKEAKVSALESLAEALGSVAMTSTGCGLANVREKALVTIAAGAKDAVRSCVAQSVVYPIRSERVKILYESLFQVLSKCRDNLGRSWVPVVEALEQLDMFAHKAEVDSEAESNGLSSTAALLKPKLELVFTSASQLNWSACHDLISALVQCSRQTVASILKQFAMEDKGKADPNRPLRVFGISAAETTILHAFKRENNTFDTLPATLWQILTGHLTSVCTNSGLYSLRQLALNSLTRVACGAISSGDPPLFNQDKIITPFLDLFTSSHSDIRSGSLSAIHTILETQGERLKGELAWTAVLKALSTAAGSTVVPTVNGIERSQSQPEQRAPMAGAVATPVQNADMMSEAFKVVQVISDDFLASLVESALPAWIGVLGLYSRQDDDVNVALTSIGLLWRTADFFAKSNGLSEEDRLWVQLFEILKEISVHEKPEIRNCAVKTLTGTLSAHSIRLSARAWNGCVEKALLPLLEQVMKGGVVSEEQAVSGKNRGDVQLLLHHSRDTPRKQWNETRVLALAGVAKVLRTAMPRLAVLQDKAGRPLFFMLTDGGPDGLWRKMLRAAGVAAGSRDGEVAIAGVSALLELLRAAGFVVAENSDTNETSPSLELSTSAPASLGANGTSDSSPSMSWTSDVMGGSEAGVEELAGQDRKKRAHVNNAGAILLWEAVWSALSEAIGGLKWNGHKRIGEGKIQNDSSKIVDEKALEMLAEGLLEARVKSGRKFTSRSSGMFVEVLLYLAQGRDRGKDVKETGESQLTGVQEASLKGLENIELENDNESWTIMVRGLLEIIKEETNACGGPSCLARRSLDIVGDLYAGSKLPVDVKKAELRSLLHIVGKIMLLRNENENKNIIKDGYVAERGHVSGVGNKGPKHAIWMEATDVMMIAMQCGGKHGYGTQSEEVWQEFVHVTEKFLYSEQRMHMANVPEFRRDMEESERAEEYDMKLTGCVQEALSQAGCTSIETQRRLVGLLSLGAEEGKASGRPRFVRSCQRRLFSLAEVGDEKKGIAEESNKCVVEMCGRVLGQFIADGRRAGKCPLPAARRAEAVFLLQQLRRLNARNGVGQKHLMALYARLCECVDSRDESVRHLARELLDEAVPVDARTNRGRVLGAGVKA